MHALTPWTGTGLRREMDRLFDRFFDSPLSEVPAFGDFTPALDVTEGKDAFSVKAELPGVDPKDVSIALEGDMLIIKGEKEQKKEEKDERHHRVERSWGNFMRSVRLPVSVDAGRVTAAYKNGVITITLPKAQGARGTTIPVKAE